FSFISIHFKIVINTIFSSFLLRRIFTLYCCNYYTREMMNEEDNPPIGIVLCADKSDQVVKYTLPEDNNQIFASKYELYLPKEEEFKKELNLDNYVKKEENKSQNDVKI